MNRELSFEASVGLVDSRRGAGPRWTSDEVAKLSWAFEATGDVYRHYMKQRMTKRDYWNYVAGKAGLKRSGRALAKKWDGPQPEDAHVLTLEQELAVQSDPLMARAAQEIAALRKQLQEAKGNA